MKFSKYYLLLPLFFPWLGSALNGFDTQPWLLPYLLLSYLLFAKFKYSRSIGILAVIFFLISFNLAFSFDLAPILRGVFGVSVALLSYELFKDLKSHKIDGVVILANWIYIVVGVLQFIVSPFLFSWLVEVRTSAGRGVTGLTPEPTFYGLVLVFFAIYSKFILKDRFLTSVNLIFVVLVAKSSSALAAVALMAALFVIMNGSTISKMVTGPLLVAFLSIPFLIDLGRISYLIKNLADISALISDDFSVMMRLSDIVSSPFMVFHNYGMPIPFDQVSIQREVVTANLFDGIFYYTSVANRTSSYLGDLTISLGLPVFIFLILLYFKSVRRGNSQMYLSALCLAPFSLPMNSIFIPMLIVFSLINKR